MAKLGILMCSSLEELVVVLESWLIKVCGGVGQRRLACLIFLTAFFRTL